MLQNLKIENYALIRSLDVQFERGFTVITGETGAGKSILLGALHLILGQRADVQVLFHTDKKCLVEASFDIKGLGLEPLFEENDWDYDSLTLIRREILPNGKSRAFVNDTPASLQALKDLGSRLIDIHSQHQSLTLHNAAFQLNFLDMISGNPLLLKNYKKKYASFRILNKNLAELREKQTKNQAEKEYHAYLLEELTQAKLILGEQDQLEQELELIKHAAQIKQCLTEASYLLNEGDEAVNTRLHSLKISLGKLINIKPSLGALYERLDACLAELKDMASEFAHEETSVDFSADRQEEIDQRLDLLYRLSTKHQVKHADKLIELRESLTKEILVACNLENMVQETEKQYEEEKELLEQLALHLHQIRTKAAARLEAEIRPLLQQLSMKESELRVELRLTEDFSENGKDEISFLFRSNQDAVYRELGKVASGGELSRLMLACKSLITESSLLPCIIFDEIDSGVSGNIAGQVGEMMLLMAKNMQVIAITHLPQIAAKASFHYRVMKVKVDNSTASSLVRLKQDERIQEIAQMLSSENPSSSAIQTARELLSLTGDSAK